MRSIEVRSRLDFRPAPVLLIMFSMFATAGIAMQTHDESMPRETLIVVGIVVLEDGTPPRFGVVIERDCGLGYKREVETESSGHFLFEMSRDSLPEILPGDFSARDQLPREFAMRKRAMPASLEVNFCELRARMQGFRSTAVRIAADPGSKKVDVGSIVLRPNRKNTSSVVSITSLKAPPKARKALERAQKALKKREFEKAAGELNTALEIYPQYAEAWYYLDWMDDQRRQYEKASEKFGKSIALDATYVLPYLGLASAAWQLQDWPAMKRWSEQALELNARSFPEAYFLNALALYYLNVLDAAEKSLRDGGAPVEL